jgi:1,4-dihydroxy-2-naphthoate octaprenyltransferase
MLAEGAHPETTSATRLGPPGAKSLLPWWLAARPKTLMAGICPVLLGSSFAIRDGHFHAGAAMAAIVGALAIQIGTNYSNDYFDFVQGADTADRIGPMRAVQAGWVTPRGMLIATIVMFLLAACCCVYLVSRAGWPLAVIGAASIFCGVWYTASRFSLAYLGLGDLFVLVFFGPVAVGGTYFVQALQWQRDVLFAGLGPGLLSVAILVVNNLRDIQQDAKAQKRTLAVRFGSRFARGEYTMCMLGATAVPLMLWWRGGFSWTAIAIAAAVAPGWDIAIRQLPSVHGASLNPYLGKTGAILLIYTITFSIVSITS